MGGVETGLDLAGALARVPDGIEAHAVRRLLLMAEGAALKAIGEKRDELQDRSKGNAHVET
ncbi:MAG: hypothetical protein AB1418_13605 [Pseudomonadota bacterium]|jgi:hypothetical protein